MLNSLKYCLLIWQQYLQVSRSVEDMKTTRPWTGLCVSPLVWLVATRLLLAVSSVRFLLCCSWLDLQLVRGEQYLLDSSSGAQVFLIYFFLYQINVSFCCLSQIWQGWGCEPDVPLCDRVKRMCRFMGLTPPPVSPPVFTTRHLPVSLSRSLLGRPNNHFSCTLLITVATGIELGLHGNTLSWFLDQGRIVDTHILKCAHTSLHTTHIQIYSCFSIM